MPPAVNVVLGLVGVLGGLVLLSDGIFRWSNADDIVRWSYILWVPLLVGFGFSFVVLGVRGLRRSGSSE